MSKKKFKRVLIVLGGTSGERSISLETGKACIKALKKKKYHVSTFDPKYMNFNQIDQFKVDVIFNALHGKDGEDGVAQSYFECLRIPYTHSGIISSYNAMNKIISKEIFIKNKILTPKYFDLNKDRYNDTTLKNLIKAKGLSFPIVVKPVSEGSSLGVKIAMNIKDLKKSIRVLFKNELPIYEVISGATLAFAAFLLILPGFATDLIGILLVVPFTRKIILGRIIKKNKFNFSKNKNYIDGDYEELEEDDNKKV